MGKAKHIAFIMYQICLFRFGSYTYFAHTHTSRVKLLKVYRLTKYLRGKVTDSLWLKNVCFILFFSFFHRRERSLFCLSLNMKKPI